ncbi:hypothetical protein BCD67_06820 [Oscillatoriales cyanobacterium USR001]|nr:hypothetical protein BCD67_06820 [Oscillatoriales cyanobacterium USR001]
MINSASIPQEYQTPSLELVPEDSEMWESLKQASAASSGFQRWQLEQDCTPCTPEDAALDKQVTSYLRETLETLAY